MMHLSFLTPEYPHPRVDRAAGIGTSIKNLATGLAEKKIKVTIFIYSQNEDAVLEEHGITLHLIKHRKYPLFGWFLYRKHLANYINKVILKDKIDAIEAPDWTGITAFIKLRAPLVIRLHGSDAYFCKLEGRPQKKKNYWFESKALRNADAIISVSKFTAKLTKEIFGLMNTIKILHNGIDTKKFKPLDLPNNSNSILYFGTIIRKKGVLDLAQAFQLLKIAKPQVTLTLIGKDNIDIFEKKSTLKLINEYLDESARSAVTHLDHMAYQEVVKQISMAQVVVLPSRAEAFPMSWLEAMAMEKALITSNIGWAKELMIHNHTGLMIDPNEHQELANGILEILDDDEKGSTFGKNARERIVEHFSLEKIVQENIDFYKSFTE